MTVNHRHYRTIWLKEEDPSKVCIINQLVLPFRFEIIELATLEDARRAIKDMYVRGAGLIGATAAWGMYLAALNGNDLNEAAQTLKATRPTASNLAYAVDRIMSKISTSPLSNSFASLRLCVSLIKAEAQAISDEDAEMCRQIGLNGLSIIEDIARKKAEEGRGGEPVNILTHCNAGWLAFVDYGTALSPVYAAFNAGIPLHVWVDETRPRNQGASLTAWELSGEGVPHDLIADNAGGHLMQHGLVDMVITGADRVTRQGDAANKIGTYLKALAAKENGVPFYVAFPSSTFDFSMKDGVKEIPIEERDAGEVRYISGKTKDGRIETVEICPPETPARNWGFDVTPAKLITALITERGIMQANEDDIRKKYKESV
ncbi:MAG: S-methyl-5-thioribose-1-phosphate isomerase [Spirochaetaceae bacterium]|jgi:methylthioribose-1-phosphate isomerase|nr:S-methyl-5-thioribose-1-phosphate isomerase [Spirochaetaceae bacterium]